jgi:hypothetical protein
MLLITMTSKRCIVENWMITIVVIVGILGTNLGIVIHQTVQLTLLVQLLLKLKEILLLLDWSQFAEIDLVPLQLHPVFVLLPTWKVEHEVLNDKG